MFQNLSVVKVVDHQCPSDSQKNEVDLPMADLKKDVIKSDESIPKMFNETVVSISIYLFAVGNTRTRMQRTGKRRSTKKKITSFVLAEYEGENRILIFCSQKMRDSIQDVTEIFFDATYQGCPKPFYQLLTVHCEFESSAETTNVKPMIRTSYSIVFKLIQKELNWNPNIVLCYFERASINAVFEVFPVVKILVCYYHWARCVWRKAKSLGNTNKQSKDVSLL